MNYNPYVEDPWYSDEQYLGSGAIKNRLFSTGVAKGGSTNRYCLICSQELGTDQRATTAFNIDGLVGQVHKACMGVSEKPARKADVQYNASYHEPIPTASQCVLCHRGIQDGENIVTRRGIKAHSRCVESVLEILGRGDGPATPAVPEARDRANVRKAIGMTVDVDHLARLIAEKYH